MSSPVSCLLSPGGKRLSFWWLLIVAFAPYAPFLWVPFHFDDLSHIVHNRGLTDLPAALPRDLNAYFARGVTNLTFALQRQVWGEDPYAFRVFNVLVHACNGWWLCLLVRRILAARRMRGGRRIGRWAALLFLLHPLATGSVVYISGRPGMLSTVFILLALHRFWDVLRSGRGASWTVLCAGLALGCKEDALALPVLMAALHRLAWAGAAGSRGAPPRKAAVLPAVACWAAVLALVGLFFGTRLGWLSPRQEPAAARQWKFTEAERMYDREDYLRTQCVVIPSVYLAKWGVPTRLSIDLDVPVRWRWDGPALVGAGFLAAWGALALGGLFRGRAWGFWALWTLAALAPSSSFQPLEDLAGEHRAYMASAALAFLSASVLWHFAGRTGAGRVAFGFLLGCFLILSLARNGRYWSVHSLWRDAVLDSPRKGKPYFAVGGDYLERKDRDPRFVARARRFFLTALAAQPEDSRSDFYLARLHWETGDLAQADRCLKQAIHKKPDHVPFLLAFAELAAARGDWVEACDRYRKVAALAPENAEATDGLRHSVLRARAGIAELESRYATDPGQIEAGRDLALRLQRLGEAARAGQVLRDLAHRFPADLHCWNTLATFLFEEAKILQAADPGRAEQMLREADEAAGHSLALAPQDPFLHAFRAEVAAARGRWDAAAASYREALGRMPNQAAWWTAIGIALGKLDRRQEAVEAFQRALSLDPADLMARNGLERLGK